MLSIAVERGISRLDAQHFPKMIDGVIQPVCSAEATARLRAREAKSG